MKFGVAATALCGLVAMAGPAMAQDTLAQVQERGEIYCGVGENFAGFFSPDSTGKYSGFDVDFCHAVAAAVLGDASKVKTLPATPAARFTQLQSGQVDLLSRSVTETFSREASLGFDFPIITFYDGHALMVPKSLGITTAADLDGANVCTQTGLSTEVIVADYFNGHGLSYNPVVFEGREQALAAYDSGRCDVFSSDRSTLFAYRSNLSDPDAHVVLPETISKSLNGPVVRHGDNNWADIVRWTGFALIAADEAGITSANVDEIRADDSAPAAVRRMLGVEGEFGAMLGLSNDWFYNIIKQVGNYGEIYERNLGEDGAVTIPREGTLNALWTDGGLMIAPAFQ